MTNKDTAKPHILVIEDDELTREAVLLKLEKVGFASEFAKDGVEGMNSLLSGRAFDGILLDLRMPNGDGFMFMEKKNSDARFLDIPIIVFSNLSQSEFIDRAVSLGAKGYLVKAQHSIQDVVYEVKKCITNGVCTIDT